MSAAASIDARSDRLALIGKSELEDSAQWAVREFICGIGAGTISARRIEQLGASLRMVVQIGGDIGRIVAQGHEITRAGAKCARDAEQCASEIDGFVTKRAENELTRTIATETQKHVAGAIKEELRLRELTAGVHADELQDRRDARNAAREQQKQRDAEDRAASQRRIDRHQAHRSARADAARQKNEDAAARITRDVQIGSVPSGGAHPYHAYAACVYLAAKLDDRLSSDDAAARTREAVLALMLGRDLAPDEIEAYRAAYADLKQRAADGGRRRDASAILAAATQFTGGVQ